jgi:hypothetical protein
MISNNFFAGSVSEPPLVTEAAHRLDEHVRQDGNRVLPLDNPLEELQFAQQICLPDDKLHVVVTSRDARPNWWLISSIFKREIL